MGTDVFTPAQWGTLQKLVEDAKLRYGSELAIRGHHEVNSEKTCPGFDVQQWLTGGMVPLEGHIL